MEFILKTIFNASPEAIYKAYLNSERHSAMTGGEAMITDTLGEPFTAWDGYIEGVNLALEPNRRILQSWRTSQFLPAEEDSQVEILLKETEDGTELILIHSKLPESGEHYKQGWEDHYFIPMREYFK